MRLPKFCVRPLRLWSQHVCARVALGYASSCASIMRRGRQREAASDLAPAMRELIAASLFALSVATGVGGPPAAPPMGEPCT